MRKPVDLKAALCSLSQTALLSIIKANNKIRPERVRPVAPDPPGPVYPSQACSPRGLLEHPKGSLCRASELPFEFGEASSQFDPSTASPEGIPGVEKQADPPGRGPSHSRGPMMKGRAMSCYPKAPMIYSSGSKLLELNPPPGHFITSG